MTTSLLQLTHVHATIPTSSVIVTRYLLISRLWGFTGQFIICLGDWKCEIVYTRWRDGALMVLFWLLYNSLSDQYLRKIFQYLLNVQKGWCTNASFFLPLKLLPFFCLLKFHLDVPFRPDSPYSFLSTKLSFKRLFIVPGLKLSW